MQAQARHYRKNRAGLRFAQEFRAIAMAQADFENLEALTLAKHGYSVERTYWPSVVATIPTYETFWKRFVVLLTNRIDPLAVENWVRIRRGLRKPYELLLMENYTVFYDLVVALKQVTQGKQALSAGGYYHAEAFFFYLHACVENTGVLVRDARKLLNGAAIRPQIKSIPDNLMKEVKRYRDVASHRPLLGRGSKYGREMMMKVTCFRRSIRMS